MRGQLIIILVAAIVAYPGAYVDGFHVGLADEDPNPAFEWFGQSSKVGRLLPPEQPPSQVLLSDNPAQQPTSTAINKRFLFHSNGDCSVFRVQCFTNRDCNRRYNSLSYRCVMHRCAITCHRVTGGRHDDLIK